MNARATVSAVVITCDDAEVLQPCLDSVAGWVDEIVVLDMHSTDESRAIAERHGARVELHPRLAYCEPARNAAIALATSDWVLVLDPDERITAPLASVLQRIAAEGEFDVVDIPRIQVAFGRPLTAPGARDGSHPRFFRRGATTWPTTIHDLPSCTGLRRTGVDAEGAVMLHDTWRSPHQVLAKLARYVPEDARRRRERGERFSFGGMVAATAQELRYRLVIGRAYEDGVAGFVNASLFAVERFCVHAEMWHQDGASRDEDQAVLTWGRRVERSHRGVAAVWRPAKRAVRRTRGLLRGRG